MGYMTHYKLSVVGTSKIPYTNDRKVMNRDEEYVEFVRFIEQFHDGKIKDVETGMSVPLSWIYDFWTNKSEKVKWYEHQEDMKIFSRKFPNLVFKLHGIGEEPGDEWNKYFKNGKVQICYAEITFPDFDESKLI